MATHITAVLDHDTLVQLTSELTPLKIQLGAKDSQRYFWIDRPSIHELVAGRGLRIRTSAKVQWTLAGLPIPLTLSSATLLLSPQISTPPGKLLFRISLEELDVKNVPEMIDSQLRALINEGLRSLGDVVSWNYAKTLTVRAQLPDAAAPLDAFKLEPGDASVSVGASEITMKVELPMHFTMRG